MPMIAGRGITALLVAVGLVVVLLILVPAYRWFFLISLLVGIGVALFLRYWYARKPVDVENKRPLGLD